MSSKTLRVKLLITTALALSAVAGAVAKADATTPGPNGVMTFSRGEPDRILSASLSGSPSALHGHLLFTRTQGTDVQSIFLATSSGERRVTRPGAYCCVLRISPNHQKILVMPGGDIPPPVAGETINLAGGGFKRLALVDPKLNLVPQTWSPNGTRIAFERSDDSNASRTGIYTANAADGTGLVRVTTRPYLRREYRRVVRLLLPQRAFAYEWNVLHLRRSDRYCRLASHCAAPTPHV